MPEHDRDYSERIDTNRWTPDPPCLAHDLGQRGFPVVFVVKKLADSVNEYMGGGGKDPLSFEKNSLVRCHDTDAVFRCIFVNDSPLKPPKKTYPVPEGRLALQDTTQASPVDDSGPPNRHPRDDMAVAVLESMYEVAYAFDTKEYSTPSPGEIDALLAYAVSHVGIDSDLVREAKEVAEATVELEGEQVTITDGTAEFYLNESGSVEVGESPDDDANPGVDDA